MELSPMKAIKAHCISCTYDAAEPGTNIAQVEACTIIQCELYHLRPLTGATKDRLREEKVAAMTPDELCKYRAKQEAARQRLHTSNSRPVEAQ